MTLQTTMAPIVKHIVAIQINIFKKHEHKKECS